jgi:hypothetical protein
VVEQAARRGHQDFHAGLQRGLLGLHVDAAEHHGAAQGQVLVVGHHAFMDLDDQFPGGGEDQGAHRVPGRGGAGVGVGEHLLQQGQGEGGGLAGAGLGLGHEIPAGEHQGNGLLLDRGGNLVAHLVQGREDLGIQAQVREGGGRFQSGCSFGADVH